MMPRSKGLRIVPSKSELGLFTLVKLFFYFGLSITVDNDVLGGMHGDLRWVLLVVTYKKMKIMLATSSQL